MSQARAAAATHARARAAFARHASLFADDLARLPALLTGLAVAGRRCLDLESRSGAGARALREAGARLVWASDADPVFDAPALRGGGARRFLAVPPALLTAHPTLVAEGPDGGFDLVLCASVLARALPPDPPGQARALGALAALLAPGGQLVFTRRRRAPPRRPVVHRPTAGADVGLLVVEQRDGALRREVRCADGLAPAIVTAACLDLASWRRALSAAGLDALSRDPLDPGWERLIAARAPTSHP